jgi:hypothetical protein
MPFIFVEKLMKRKIKKIIYKGLDFGNRRYQEIKIRFSKINKKAVFIIGNQKSGTTVIAALLGHISGEKPLLDVYCRLDHHLEQQILRHELSFQEFIQMNRRFFTQKIIKEPAFVFQADQIIQCFPDARCVFVLRDPRDNIRSILNRLKLPGNQQQLTREQMENLPNILWQTILDGELFGTRGNNYIETLAHRWKRGLEIREQFSDKIEVVRYEEFMKDKERFIFFLAQKLGLPVRHDITPYLDIQYQPKGDHSVSWVDFFGSKNLSIIEKICSEKMQSYGYKPLMLS